jgi:hypothetical protein
MVGMILTQADVHSNPALKALADLREALGHACV